MKWDLKGQDFPEVSTLKLYKKSKDSQVPDTVLVDNSDSQLTEDQKIKGEKCTDKTECTFTIPAGKIDEEGDYYITVPFTSEEVKALFSVAAAPITPTVEFIPSDTYELPAAESTLIVKIVLIYLLD